MNGIRDERKCGNCCFCISQSSDSSVGDCAMKKHATVRKESTAESIKCRKHLYKRSAAESEGDEG